MDCMDPSGATLEALLAYWAPKAPTIETAMSHKVRLEEGLRNQLNLITSPVRKPKP